MGFASMYCLIGLHLPLKQIVIPLAMISYPKFHRLLHLSLFIQQPTIFVLTRLFVGNSIAELNKMQTLSDYQIHKILEPIIASY